MSDDSQVPSSDPKSPRPEWRVFHDPDLSTTVVLPSTEWTIGAEIETFLDGVVEGLTDEARCRGGRRCVEGRTRNSLRSKSV